MEQNKTIIIDTETTGLLKYGERTPQVLQLSIIDINGNVLFNEYFKPRGIKQWNDAEKVHHINYDMVKNKHTFKYYQKQVQSIIDNANTIIGYNIDFDLCMIQNYINLSKFENKPYKLIDVMPIFAEIYGEKSQYYDTYKWQKLTTATKYFNYDWNEYGHPHGALADTMATLFVYNKCMELLNNK